MHEYFAVLRKVVTGETLRLDIDLGFHMRLTNVVIGLEGVTCAPLDEAAREFVKQWMGNVNVPLVIQVERDHGWSARVWRAHEMTSFAGFSLNEAMIEAGYATHAPVS